ncbi:MAG: TetR/AcrR family transcriptional regulator [Actinobacteria bacterium]|nr:TetR/AcrR family transcriptional regulator [Actinomycetota bacterium]
MATATSRRTPQQQRSRAKVDAILDASERIVTADGLDGLTTTIVAEQAGIAVGTLYQYFDSIDAILDALIARHAESFALQLKEALSGQKFRRKRDAANAALDELIEYYRSHPSFRALWRGAPSATGAGFGDEAGDVLIGLVIEAIESQGMASRADPDFVLEVEVQWSLAQALIRLAFRRDPKGDAAVLNHLRRLFDLDVDPVET